MKRKLRMAAEVVLCICLTLGAIAGLSFAVTVSAFAWADFGGVATLKRVGEIGLAVTTTAFVFAVVMGIAGGILGSLSVEFEEEHDQ